MEDDQSSLSSISNFSNSEDFKKVVLIGDPSVGKSSILIRFIKNTFSDDIKTTLGVDHFQKRIGERGRRVKLNIWDTAGQERYRSMAQIYHKGADCVIIVFDISRRETFDRIDFWRKEVLTNAKINVLVVIVGNKTDLESERKVMREEIEKYVGQFGYFYIETSACDNRNNNIDKLFYHVGNSLSDYDGPIEERKIPKKKIERISFTENNYQNNRNCNC